MFTLVRYSQQLARGCIQITMCCSVMGLLGVFFFFLEDLILVFKEVKLN